MAAVRGTPVDARPGITFEVTIDVQWNAPEAHVQLTSAGVFDLDKSLTDVFGFCGRRPDAAVSRVTRARDDRGVHVLVPDPRVPGYGFSRRYDYRHGQNRWC